MSRSITLKLIDQLSKTSLHLSFSYSLAITSTVQSYTIPNHLNLVALLFNDAYYNFPHWNLMLAPWFKPLWFMSSLQKLSIITSPKPCTYYTKLHSLKLGIPLLHFAFIMCLILKIPFLFLRRGLKLVLSVLILSKLFADHDFLFISLIHLLFYLSTKNAHQKLPKLLKPQKEP